MNLLSGHKLFNSKNFIRLFCLSEKNTIISKQALFLLQKMDGRTSTDDLKRKFKKRFSIDLTDVNLARLIRKLKENHYLVGMKHGYPLTWLSPYYKLKIKKKIKAEFKKNKIRNAMFDGLMYKGNPVSLIRDLKACFATVNEKKLSRTLRKIDNLKGVIVPHSNIEQSGACAAWAYRAIELMGLPDIIVLLVPNHAIPLKRYPFSVCKKPFRTPLGTVQVNRAFIDRLAKESKFNIFKEDLSHAYEHAIEIQLPFLQFIYNTAGKYLSIVPIICTLSYPQSHKESFEKLKSQFLYSLRSCLLGSTERVLVIASGDLHHQRGLKISADFHEKNQKIIQAMEHVRATSIRKLIKEGIRTCGRHSFLAFFDVLKPEHGFLLNYSWSYRKNLLKKSEKNTQYDWIERIGFASMVF